MQAISETSALCQLFSKTIAWSGVGFETMQKLFDFSSDICYIAKKNGDANNDFARRSHPSIRIVSVEKLNLSMKADLLDAILNLEPLRIPEAESVE